MLNVQAVLEERYPGFFERSKLITTPTLAVLKMLTHEKEMRQFEQSFPNCVGLEFVEQVLNYFSFSYSVRHNERERIPTKGRVVIIANHPIGTLDGLALLKMVSEVRSDAKVVANDLLTNLKPLSPVLLPVNNMGTKGRKNDYQNITQHLQDEGALIVFPAGEVSRMGPTGIKDSRWRPGFFNFASQTKSPILPIFIDARNSLFFYSLSLLSKPLSTLWLVRETFKHSENSVLMRIGELIDPGAYEEINLPLKTKLRLFRKQVYRLAKDKPSLFRTQSPIAHPENRQQLKREIDACESLGATRDNKKILLYRYSPDSPIMREMGRLREEAFRLIGEGTGLRRDIDEFDAYYMHIVLWDDSELEIVGAYRLIDTRQAIAERGIKSLYTATLFQYKADMEQVFQSGLELGRSFVQPKYWGSRSLEYLWYGISAFLIKHPQYRYLMGAVSISNSFSRAAKNLIVRYYQRYYGSHKQWLSCRTPFVIDAPSLQGIDAMFDGLDARQAFILLKEQLSHMGFSVPTLYKQYTELCNPGGVEFLGFNIDPDFNDCIDGLVVVDISHMAATKRKRYGLSEHVVLDINQLAPVLEDG